MKLSAPSLSLFTLSFALAAGVLSARYLELSLPLVGPMIGHAHFESIAVAYLMLAAGNLFDRV